MSGMRHHAPPRRAVPDSERMAGKTSKHKKRTLNFVLWALCFEVRDAAVKRAISIRDQSTKYKALSTKQTIMNQTGLAGAALLISGRNADMQVASPCVRAACD